MTSKFNSLNLNWENKPSDFAKEKYSEVNFVKYFNEEIKKLESWNNLLFKGDNSTIISSLLESNLFDFISNFGGVKLVYIDPPYFTGKSQKMKTISHSLAFNDKFNNSIEQYLSTIFIQLNLLKILMNSKGSIYVHIDYRTSSYIKLIMDEIFGSENMQGYIIWNLNNGAKSKRTWSNQHNDILVYSKSENFIFNHQSATLKTPFSDVSLKTHFRNKDKNGRNYRVKKVNSKSYKYFADEGKMVGSVWNDLKSMEANSPLMKEYTGYPTQKPRSLLKRIISASSNPGDIILDTYCGSGTTLKVATELKRKWIGVDVGHEAIRTSKKQFATQEYFFLEPSKF